MPLHSRKPIIGPSRVHRLVFSCAANIEDGQGNLQNNQRVGITAYAPDNPQYITEEKAPKACLSLGFGLGRDQPCGRDRNHHGGPLYEIKIFHWSIKKTLMTPQGSLRTPHGEKVCAAAGAGEMIFAGAGPGIGCAKVMAPTFGAMFGNPTWRQFFSMRQSCSFLSSQSQTSIS